MIKSIINVISVKSKIIFFELKQSVELYKYNMYLTIMQQVHGTTANLGSNLYRIKLFLFLYYLQPHHIYVTVRDMFFCYVFFLLGWCLLGFFSILYYTRLYLCPHMTQDTFKVRQVIQPPSTVYTYHFFFISISSF